MSRKNLDLYFRAIYEYSIEAQEWMLIEECGELMNAFAKLKRGRASREDVLTELADVHIMVEQMACFFGIDDFEDEKKRKLERLEERLNNH